MVAAGAGHFLAVAQMLPRLLGMVMLENMVAVAGVHIPPEELKPEAQAAQASSVSGSLHNVWRPYANGST
jgi:hypothetical protein